MIALDVVAAYLFYRDEPYVVARILVWLTPYAGVTSPTAAIFTIGHHFELVTGGYVERLRRSDAALARGTELIVVVTGVFLGSPIWLAIAAATGPVVRNLTARHFVESP